MSKIKKILIAVGIVCLLAQGNPVYAAEEQNIEISTIEKMGIPATTLGAGETVNFIDNDGMPFYVPGGAKVSFSVNLKSSGTIEMGYRNSSGTKVKKYSGSGKSHSTSFTIGSTGYYKFYVTNKTSGTITITGGSLKF